MSCYILGCGVLAQGTTEVDDFFNKLCDATLFYGPLTGERWKSIEGFRTVSGGSLQQETIESISSQAKSARLGDIVNPCELFAAHAIRKALLQAGVFPVPKGLRVGLVIGTNFGNADAIVPLVNALSSGEEYTGPIENYLFGSIASRLAGIFGLNGSVNALSLSCASGVSVIAAGKRILDMGEHDAIVACGVDELETYIFSGLHALRAMSPEGIARPWDKNRKGAIFAEGAAAVVLSPTPSPKWTASAPLASVRGCYQNNDAFHLSAPDTTASGITKLIARTLENSSVAPHEIDMINLHGTGTPYNDRIETKAIENVFADHARVVPATANKGALAHLMGAAGIAEVVSTVMSLKTGLIPPTANILEKDPELSLNIVTNEPLDAHPRLAMKNSFGFGGVNSCIVLERFDG